VTPFEEIMVVYKQVMMLLNHARHSCTVWEADLGGNNYVGTWVAVTLEAERVIIELIRTKTKAAVYAIECDLRVSCPVTNEESRKVRRMKEF
jgi:hypothetical protein